MPFGHGQDPCKSADLAFVWPLHGEGTKEKERFAAGRTRLITTVPMGKCVSHLWEPEYIFPGSTLP